MTATFTSISAFHSITADREVQEQQLLHLYEVKGPQTDREAYHLLGWEAPSVVSARRNGLMKRYEVGVLGEKKAETGKTVTVWGLIKNTLF